MLRYCVPIKTVPFFSFLWILSIEFNSSTSITSMKWRNSTPHFASLPERGNENIKYFIFSSGNQTHNLSHLPSNVCALDNNWPYYELILCFLSEKNLTVREITQFPTSVSKCQKELYSTGKSKKKQLYICIIDQ